MRSISSVAIVALVLACGHAECQQARAAIQSVGVTVRPDATAIVIETSGDTPVRVVPEADRVDLEFPQAEWRAKSPQIDRRTGLIESFRKVPSAQGVHLVFMTRTGYALRDGGPIGTAPNGDRIVTVVLGAPSTAPLVSVTGDGPVVIEGSGYVPAPSSVKPATAQPVQPSVECTPRLVPQGSIDGKPVLGYSSCPAASKP